MQWLLTGGCGFIGSALAERLVAEGHAVRVLDNLSVGKPEALADIAPLRRIEAQGAAAGWTRGAVELMVGDIRDADAAAAACRGAAVVVHLAANAGVMQSIANPRADMDVNVAGTLGMLEAARAAGCGRFVLASSNAALGAVEPPAHEGRAPNPVSPYGAAKLAAEAYCLAYHHAYGLSSAVLRFGNVYGPRSGHKGSVVALFIRQALAGQPWEIHGDGGQTRDFVFIGDLVRAVIAAGTAAPLGGEVFQIASARETTINELADTLAGAFEAAGRPRPAMRHGERRAGDVARNYSDTSKAAERLGWRAETPLPEGLCRTLDWFLADPRRATG
ncbi:MAG: NAD-dependent epimerase/dehydratase family protein [Alphaproteobacteria bacterium]|nr:NAD-dependent epimerase/dehydratase family protein [Alphaproteobacteria bacterium]